MTCSNNQNDEILGNKSVCCKNKTEKCVVDVHLEKDRTSIHSMEDDVDLGIKK